MVHIDQYNFAYSVTTCNSSLITCKFNSFLISCKTTSVWLRWKSMQHFNKTFSNNHKRRGKEDWTIIEFKYKIYIHVAIFQTMSAPGNSNKRLSLPALHYGMSLNDISMRKSPAHRTRSSTDFVSSKSPPFGSEQHLSRRSRRMSLVSAQIS